MIYDSDKGDRGKVFSNGKEVDLAIEYVNTETGECLYAPEPFEIQDGELVKKTVFLENVTFEPL